MPRTVLRREDAVERITEVFRTYGYEGSSLRKIREATGLPPSSLYNYFPEGKEDMARAALAWVEDRFNGPVLGALDGPGDARSRAEAFAQALRAFYHDGSAGCLVNQFGIAGAPDALGKALSLELERMNARLARFCEEAGHAPEEARAVAEDALIAIQGALVLSHALKDNGPFERVAARLPTLLAPEPRRS